MSSTNSCTINFRRCSEKDTIYISEPEQRKTYNKKIRCIFRSQNPQNLRLFDKVRLLGFCWYKAESIRNTRTLIIIRWYLAPFFSRARPKSGSVSRSSRAQYVFFKSRNLVYSALRVSTRAFFRSLISCMRLANLRETKKEASPNIGLVSAESICYCAWRYTFGTLWLEHPCSFLSRMTWPFFDWHFSLHFRCI